MRLELIIIMYMMSCVLYFNSIKVRLEPARSSRYPSPPEFQFHKGAIRTPLFGLIGIIIPLFQFHKGAIRTILSLKSYAVLFNFNSIKVRLEQQLGLVVL